MTSSFSPAVRRLIAATLVNTLGNGVYAAVAALYLTRAVGLSVAHVGVGLTVAALVGLVASTPLGSSRAPFPPPQRPSRAVLHGCSRTGRGDVEPSNTLLPWG